jgi:hypothetical protein
VTIYNDKSEDTYYIWQYIDLDIKNVD